MDEHEIIKNNSELLVNAGYKNLLLGHRSERVKPVSGTVSRHVSAWHPQLGAITLNDDVVTVKQPHRATLSAPNKELGINVKLRLRTYIIYTNSHHRLVLFVGGSSVLWLARVRGVGELDSALRPFTAAALWEREELRGTHARYFSVSKNIQFYTHTPRSTL